MVAHGLKNFFKSLKHFFIPLGTMFLGMMIGLSILLPGITASISSLIDGVNQLSAKINLDFDALLECVLDEIAALDWNNFSESLHTMISGSWIYEVLMQMLSTILGEDFASLQTEVGALMFNFAGNVISYTATFFAFWVIGFFAGAFLIKILIRRSIVKRSLWKVLLTYFVNSILTTAAVVISVFIFSIWSYGVYISTVITLLLYGMISLFQAYLLFGYRKIKLKNIVNAKNIGLYMLTNTLIFLIAIVFSVLVFLLNALTGFFVGLALIVIAFIVIELNAESYVQNEVKKLAELPSA